MRYFEKRSAFFEASLPQLALGIGVSLVVIPVATYFMSSVAEGELFIHLSIVSPFVATIIYGGYWLDHGTLPPRRWPRVGDWFLGILFAFLAINGVMMLRWGTGVLNNLYWGAFAADVGGAAGLAIGIFEAQAIEQERVAEQNRIRRTETEKRNRQLEDFAKVLSHDLRNPLNVAWGRLQLGREDCDSNHLRAVKDALARMDQIIEDVLMLTWSGQGIDPEDVDNYRLRRLAQTSWEHVDTADARLEVENDPRVQANERRLQRLLENLFRNAVEHAGPDVTVRIGALPHGFYVEDDGPGISEENREKIFDAGYSSNEEGTGLGLNIVRTIAETHGWDVSATEGQAGGVRFEFIGYNGESPCPTPET